MRKLNNLMHNNKGFAALFAVATFSLLLVTVSVSSARLSTSELRQSFDLDLSDSAYYAAEACIEEALQRLEDNKNKELRDPAVLASIFPEGATTAQGDGALIIDELGNDTPMQFVSSNSSSLEGANLKCRNRQVYRSSMSLSGTQEKDESIQVDLGTLLHVGADGRPCYSQPNRTCDGARSLHSAVYGFRYCALNFGPIVPSFEWTITRYRQADPSDIDTFKYLASYNGGVRRVSSGSFVRSVASSSNPSESCAEFRIDGASARNNYRYIVRTKPIYTNVPAGSQSQYYVNYTINLLSTGIPSDRIVIDDASVFIEATGDVADGTISRELGTKKQLNGRLLGIFDFLLYSGSEQYPLCKAGVLFDVDNRGTLSYDPETCTVNPNVGP